MEGNERWGRQTQVQQGCVGLQVGGGLRTAAGLRRPARPLSCEEGLQVSGHWARQVGGAVARQRSVYQGTLKGRLSASQVARLEELMGSAWNPSAEEWVDGMMCSAP